MGTGTDWRGDLQKLNQVLKRQNFIRLGKYPSKRLHDSCIMLQAGFIQSSLENRVLGNMRLVVMDT